MISTEEFGEWIQLFIAVIMRDIPDNIVEQDDDPESSIYWKCKKWALKIISRVFER